jgi:hypothetical protein
MTFEQVRHFHRNPTVIAAWQTRLGPLLRGFTPGRRRLLLALAALVIVVRRSFRAHDEASKWLGAGHNVFGSIVLALVLFAFVGLCYFAAKHFTTWPAFARRRPQLALHSLFWSLLVLLWIGFPANPSLRAVVAGCVLLLPFLLWRLGYMLFSAQRGKMEGTRFTDHLFYIWPAYGGSETPYGKGHDYLSSNEAKDEQSLARSQLAGLKLFGLAALCSAGRGLLRALAYGDDNAYGRVLGGVTLNLPEISELIQKPSAYPPWLAWPALYVDLFQLVLGLGSKGHVIIGWLRFFGFHVFRNTYKPLLAESIVEFWNRYYYYFKEVLVNFFFFPTFARYFKKHPRLRLFAAVFMAAFVGNLYYHLILHPALTEGRFLDLWVIMQSRLFYCFLLALGIYVSMLREQRRVRDRSRSLPRRAIAIFGVWTFFGIIHLWARGGAGSFTDRLKAFFALIGLN